MSLPYFPLYPADFEAKTSHLALEEDGAYNRLMRLMWLSPGCSLPDDDAWVMRRMRVDEATFNRIVAPIIAEFCKRVGGRIFSPRLREEFEKADETYKRRSEAGKKGGRQKVSENKRKDTKAGLSLEKAGPKQSEPEPYNTPLTPKGGNDGGDFQSFWEAYPHRGGQKKNRKGAEAKYRAAIKRGVTPDQIMAGVDAMRRFPEVNRGYARDPAVWLNQEGWTDEPPSQPSLTVVGDSPKWPEGSLRTLSPTRVQAFWGGHWENTNDYTADEAERHRLFVGRASAYANA